MTPEQRARAQVIGVIFVLMALILILALLSDSLAS